jgi:hypothetical protein
MGSHDCGSGNESGNPRGRVRTQLLGDLPAVHSRHANVDEDDVRAKVSRVSDPLTGVLHRDGLMTHGAQQLLMDPTDIGGVVNYENSHVQASRFGARLGIRYKGNPG